MSLLSRMATACLRVLRFVCFASWVAASGVGAEAGSSFDVVVSSGEIDRSVSFASFPCPNTIWNPELQLKGKRVPVQLGLDGRLYFTVTGLAAGERRSYRLRNGAPEFQRGRGVVVQEQGSALRFELDGSPVVQYQAAPSVLPRDSIDPVYRRGGYLHPVWSPSGLVVTDDYPDNHLHHHGIWVSWTKTEFDGRQPNFWEMGARRGTVEFVALDHYWSGAVFGGLKARHRFVDLTTSEAITVLNETWELKVYACRDVEMDYRLFDLTFVQECATDKPIRFPQYRYGGLGVRGHHDWDGADNANFLTGLGETDRIKGHATQAPWCHVGGLIGDQLSGLAILCHPENYRAPQPMRIHPHEPFFCYAPAQQGDWEIRPGEPYRSAYRFVVFDGLPDKARLDAFWADYAHPINVSLQPTTN